MALAGLILGYLSLLPLIFIPIWFGVIANRIHENLNYENMEPAVQAPSYHTLIGENLSGSGFHFVHREQQYIATSMHQFNNMIPKQMGHLELDSPIRIVDRVHQQNDVQIFTFESKELNSLEPLVYTPIEKIELGTPVYLYSFDEPYLGHISSRGSDLREYGIKMAKPFPAGGESGSPVVSAITGNVIGVMLSANSTESATYIGFEKLNWEE